MCLFEYLVEAYFLCLTVVTVVSVLAAVKKTVDLVATPTTYRGGGTR